LRPDVVFPVASAARRDPLSKIALRNGA
jgi:hypothetical protein